MRRCACSHRSTFRSIFYVIISTIRLRPCKSSQFRGVNRGEVPFAAFEQAQLAVVTLVELTKTRGTSRLTYSTSHSRPTAREESSPDRGPRGFASTAACTNSEHAARLKRESRSARAPRFTLRLLGARRRNAFATANAGKTFERVFETRHGSTSSARRNRGLHRVKPAAGRSHQRRIVRAPPAPRRPRAHRAFPFAHQSERADDRAHHRI